MDNITDEEKKILEELRRRTIDDLTPKMLEDASVFYRFAKARDFNLGQAETMLRKHIAWRKEMKVDSILTEYEPPEVLLKYYPISVPCFDKTGCAVIVHDLGRADAKGFLKATTKTEILKHVIYFIEKSIERVIQQGGNGKKRYQLGKTIFSPIYDFEELVYSNAVNMKVLQVSIQVVQTFLDNYPEFLKTITVINVPFYFEWIYATLKPILPSTVIKKVQIYSSDGWKEALLEYIDADDLPAYLGGNKTDPDGNPFCETLMVRGQPIPTKYYLKKGKKEFKMHSNVKKLTVSPFSKQEITFNVEEEASYLEWEFDTKNRDIDFSLLFRGESPEDMEPVKLISEQRINSSDDPHKGCYKCEKIGNYAIIFDSPFSWIHSKEVYYRARINSPRNNKLYDST